MPGLFVSYSVTIKVYGVRKTVLIVVIGDVNVFQRKEMIIMPIDKLYSLIMKLESHELEMLVAYIQGIQAGKALKAED